MHEAPCKCTKMRARVCSGIACIGSDREVAQCSPVTQEFETEGTSTTIANTTVTTTPATTLTTTPATTVTTMPATTPDGKADLKGIQATLYKRKVWDYINVLLVKY